MIHKLKYESIRMLPSGTNSDEWYHVQAGETSTGERLVTKSLSVGCQCGIPLAAVRDGSPRRSTRNFRTDNTCRT